MTEKSIATEVLVWYSNPTVQKVICSWIKGRRVNIAKPLLSEEPRMEIRRYNGSKPTNFKIARPSDVYEIMKRYLGFRGYYATVAVFNKEAPADMEIREEVLKPYIEGMDLVIDVDLKGETLEEKWSRLNDGLFFVKIINEQLRDLGFRRSQFNLFSGGGFHSHIDWRAIPRIEGYEPWQVTAKLGAYVIERVKEIAGLENSKALNNATLSVYTDIPRIITVPSSLYGKTGGVWCCPFRYEDINEFAESWRSLKMVWIRAKEENISHMTGWLNQWEEWNRIPVEEIDLERVKRIVKVKPEVKSAILVKPEELGYPRLQDLDALRDALNSNQLEPSFPPCFTAIYRYDAPQGQRRAKLSFVGGLLRNSGFMEDEIETELRKLNDELSNPLSEKELTDFLSIEREKSISAATCAKIRACNWSFWCEAGLPNFCNENCVYRDIVAHPAMWIVKEQRRLRDLEYEANVQELERKPVRKAVVDYNLPGDITKLYECRCIKALAEKASVEGMLTDEEQKAILLTLIFFGQNGESEVHKILSRCRDYNHDFIQRKIDRYKRADYLPISCAKLKARGICRENECLGSLTVVKHVFGRDPNAEAVKEIHLSELGMQPLDSFVKSEVFISGIGDEHKVPDKIFTQCQFTERAICEKCPLKNGETLSLNDLRLALDEYSIDLELLGASKEKEENVVSRYLNKYAKETLNCTVPGRIIRFDILTQRTVTPLIVLPATSEIEVAEPKARETLRKTVYLLGEKEGVFRRAKLFGSVQKDPRTSRITIVATLLAPSETGIESFKLTQEIRRKMQILEKTADEELFEILGKHVCGIVGRPVAVEGNLLAFHTPLNIQWKNEIIPSWTKTVNCGDTTSGKRIARKIKEAVGLGIYVVVETSGRTGLLYSITMTKDGPILSFGEFVFGDTGLIIIDGSDRMHAEEQAEFRESYRLGYLKVRKVVPGEAPMRTRVVTCENVKKALDEYMYPCEALLENYRTPDLARVDLAIPFRGGDVPVEEIFTKFGTPPEALPQLIEALRNNVLWVWTRRPDQIVYGEDAESIIFEKAKKLEEKFGNDIIPLISKDMDKKLAKLSAAYAGLKHSTDETGELLIIKANHVKHVSDLIDRIYSGEGMRLDDYTKITRERIRLPESEYETIMKEIQGEEEKEKLPIIDVILYELEVRGSVRLEELMAVATDEVGAAVSKETIRRRMMIFKKHRMIASAKEGYSLTAKGKAFLRRYRKEQETGLRLTAEKKVETAGSDVTEAKTGICELCGEAKARTHILTIQRQRRYVCQTCAEQQKGR